jgi:hypothetical protein
MPRVWTGVPIIVAGAAPYLWCLWLFTVVGHGTLGPWEAPRRFVAAGPYRWVRNPLYLPRCSFCARRAWLVRSPALLAYAGVAAVLFHLFVIGHEEPAIARRFGKTHADYRRASRAGSFVCHVPSAAHPHDTAGCDRTPRAHQTLRCNPTERSSGQSQAPGGIHRRVARPCACSPTRPPSAWSCTTPTSASASSRSPSASTTGWRSGRLDCPRFDGDSIPWE